jgi:hypothetical protein
MAVKREITQQFQNLVKKQPEHLFWLFFCSFLIGCLWLIVWNLIRLPIEQKVTYIPDDAFYYLTLARNFTLYHTWTFDSGVSLTTGFHLLHAYVLALLFALFQPDSFDFIDISLVCSAMVWSAALIIALWVGNTRRNYLFLICLAILISSNTFAMNIVFIMEWPYVLLLAEVYVLVLYSTFSGNGLTTRKKYGLLILAFFGSLARSDFGLLPLSLLISLVIIQRRRDAVFAPLLGLVGSTAGVIFLFVHNFLFTGGIFQSSALMKALWKQSAAYLKYGDHYILGPLSLTLPPAQIVLLNKLVFFLGILLLGVMASLLFQRLSKTFGFTIPQPEGAFIAGAMLCLLLYFWLLDLSETYPPWYSANLLIPQFILLLALFHFIEKILLRFFHNKAIPILAISVLALLLSQRVIPGIYQSAPIWPHQTLMYQEGADLSHQPLDGKIAAWNAGILGYFQGGKIINIDGLVNDDIYAYASQNRLADYIDKSGVGYIVDFSKMVTERDLLLRGGYADEQFLKRIEPVKKLGTSTGYWNQYYLYRILPHSSR